MRTESDPDIKSAKPVSEEQLAERRAPLSRTENLLPDYRSVRPERSPQRPEGLRRQRDPACLERFPPGSRDPRSFARPSDCSSAKPPFPQTICLDADHRPWTQSARQHLRLPQRARRAYPIPVFHESIMVATDEAAHLSAVRGFNSEERSEFRLSHQACCAVALRAHKTGTHCLGCRIYHPLYAVRG